MEPLIAWRAREHHHTEKSVDWYWILGIVAVCGAVLAIYFGNVLFGIFIIVAALALGLFAGRVPNEIDVAITPRGVIMGKFEYPFQNYRSFWIEDDHMHGPRILLHSRKTLLPLFSIPVSEEVDLAELRDIINDYLDEEFLRESAIHRLFDKLGI
ncbi:MAG: hypothetical protein AAB863_00280 [Patescibacteria group bacterium]